MGAIKTVDAGSAGLAALMDKILAQIDEESPALLEALFRCAVLRWFDESVLAGMLDHAPDQPSAAERLPALQKLVYVEAHPTRPHSWQLDRTFRAYLLSRPEVAGRRRQLDGRAARVFKQLLDQAEPAGSARFQDEGWRLLATEWLYHLLQADPTTGREEVWRLCATALAVPVQGANWEIEFSVRLLADLDWPAEPLELDREMRRLREGFGHLIAGRDVLALPLIKELAALPGLTAGERSELHTFAGGVHFYNEGRMGPALDELNLALSDTPQKGKIHAAMSAVYAEPKTLWGRLDLALASAERAIELAPDQPEGYEAAGRVHLLTEDWGAARAYFEKGIAADPESYECYLALSEVYRGLGDGSQAIAAIDQALEKNPGGAAYGAIWRGNAYLAAGQLAAARQAYEQALQDGPDLTQPYIALGGFFQAVGDTSAAEALYQQAIRINPQIEDGYVALGALYEQEERWERALEICRQALQNKAASKGIQIVRAGVLAKLGRLDEFEEVQRTLVALDPVEEYASACALGEACLRQAARPAAHARKGALEERAGRAFAAAVDLDEKRAWAYLRLVEQAVREENEGRQVDLEARIQQHAPWGHYDFLVSKGQALLDRRAAEAAEAALSRAIALAPRRPAAWRVLAELRAWQGEVDRLIEVWATLVDIDPALAYDAHLAIGTAYALREDYQRARDRYRQAAALQPDLPLTYWQLGELAERQGLPEEAMARYRQAAALASGFITPADLAIGRLKRQQGELKEAEKYVRRAIAEVPEKGEPYFELAAIGAAADRPGLIEEARERYGETLTADLYEWALALGFTRYELRQSERALAHLEEGLALDPGRPEAYLAIAQLLLDLEPLPEAGEKRAAGCLEQALRIDDALIGGYRLLSRLRARQHDLPGALAALERVVELDPKERVNSCLSSAGFYEQAEEPEAAAEQYRRALTAAPWRPDGYVGLARLHLAQEQLDEAGEILEQLLAVAPDHLDGHLLLAELREKQGRPDEAIDLFKHLAELLPDAFSAVHEQIGDLLIRHGRYDEATKALLLAIESDPANAGALHSLGQLFERQADWEQAAEMYSQATATDPQRLDAIVSLARTYRRQGRKEAVADLLPNLEAIERLDLTADERYWVLLGGAAVYEAMGSTLEAVDRLQRAVAQEPDRREGYINLINLWFEQGRLDEALAAARRMAAQPAVAYEGYLTLGDLWRQRPDEVTAEEKYRQAIALDGRRPEGMISLARLYLDQNRLDEAEPLLGRLLEIAPDSVDGADLLGRLYARSGRVEEAVSCYQRVAELEPEAASAMSERIGDLYLETGRLDEAQASLQEAVRSSPENAGAFFSLGLLHKQRGELDRAQAMYDRALAINPLYLDGMVALAELLGERDDQESIKTILPHLQQLEEMDLAQEERYRLLLGSARIFRSAGQPEEGVAKLQQGIDQTPYRPEAYIDLMNLYLEQGQMLEAVQVARQMASQPPLAYNGSLSLGDILQMRGDFSGAAAAYREGIDLAPAAAEGYVSLGRLLNEQGKGEEALALYREMARQPDLAYDALILEGNHWTFWQELDRAEACYRQALEEAPGRLDGICLLAQLYQSRGKLDEAEQLLEQATALYPAAPDPQELLARQRELQGRPEEAIARYREVARQFPQRFSALYEHIGDLFIELERFEEGREALHRAVERDPDNAGALFSLGTIHERRGHLPEAAERYRQALATAPAYLDALFALARICGHLGHIPELEQLSRQVGRLALPAADAYEAYLAIGSAYLAAGAGEWALEIGRKALALDEGRPDALLLMGQAYESQGLWADAREIYGQLESLMPEWRADILIRVADISIMETNLVAAEQALRQAAAHDPDRWDVHYWLGQYFLMTDRSEEAERAYLQSIDLAPERWQGHLGLGRLYERQERWPEVIAEIAVAVENEEMGPADRASAGLILAAAYRALGQGEQMKGACDAVIALDDEESDTSSGLLRLKGLAHLMAGRYEAAQEMLEAAAAADAADSKAHFYLALALAGRGQVAAARTYLAQKIGLARHPFDFEQAIQEATILADQQPRAAGVGELRDMLLAGRDATAARVGE